MKKLIISALCLIGCFVVCIKPVYADDSDNIKKKGDRIEIDSHGNVYKVDAFGNRIDDDENSQPNYVKQVCKDSKKLIHDTNAWLSRDTYTLFIYIMFGLIIVIGIFS